MELNKVKLICKQRFVFEGKTYFPGEVTSQINRIARRWVSRGLCEFVDPNALTRNGYLKHDKVSIVILVKDALEYVKKCIDSLIKCTDNFELIIVDNGSNAETKEYLKNIKCNEYTLITNTENKGFSYGCNQGIKAAKYDYICFLNSDTLLSPNWLGKLMRGFKYSPDVGIVGPSTCYSATIQSPQVFKAFRNADQDKVNKIAAMLKRDYIETPVVGFCFVIAKKVFDKIGGFDYKRYGIACGEDMDFVWRAMKAGFKSIWCRDSYVHHFGNCTTKEMGLDPHAMRVKNTPILNERMGDTTNLYIKNDVKIPKFKQIKAIGLIPIMMTTYNRLPYTKKAISALLKNTSEPCEIFIFDNNSTDGTQEYLGTIKDDRVTIHFNKENEGIIKPKNIFLDKYKDSKYVAFVDNDCIVPKGWLKALRNVMDKFPLFAVQLEHYIGLVWDFKENIDWFKHLYCIDFNGHHLYLSNSVGGSGEIVRMSYITSPIPEKRGSLSGWVHYLQDRFNMDNLISGFYDGLFMKLLDMAGTNKKIYDFPDYKEELKTLGRRDFSRAQFSENDEKYCREIRNKIENIVKSWK